jgi:hypothetical protein
VCGQQRPLARRAGPGGPAVCDRCAGLSRVGTCISCGRERPVLLRRADGQRYCKTCYPRNERPCARCGRVRLVNAEWPVGPVCGSCYTHARKHPAPCTCCGQLAVLVGAADHQAVCGRCAGWAGPMFTCRDCGAPDMLEHGRCTRCTLTSTLEELLASSTPGASDQLRQLAETLTASTRPRAALRWLRGNGGGAILAGLAAGRDPVSHELLDQLPPGRSLHFLRDRLVATRVLPERSEYLDRIPAWVGQLTASKPEGHARLIRTYAQWDALRRARRRVGSHSGAGQARVVRAKVRAASEFLDWLTGRGLDLATVRQGHLDRWLVTHRPDVARDLSPFLSWAGQRRLCGDLAIPRRPRSEPLPGLPEDQRWQHLNSCLTGDTTLPLAARAAAAITLLYGPPLTQVLTLRTTDVLDISGRRHLRLGKHPVLLPPAIARLIGQQATAAAQPTAPHGTGWLFPGRASIRPVTALAVTRQLNQHGIHIRAGRTAALVDLAGQLPPAVLASLLGLHPATAERWCRRIASDWTAYLHARTAASEALPGSLSRGGLVLSVPVRSSCGRDTRRSGRRARASPAGRCTHRSRLRFPRHDDVAGFSVMELKWILVSAAACVDSPLGVVQGGEQACPRRERGNLTPDSGGPGALPIPQAREHQVRLVQLRRPRPLQHRYPPGRGGRREWGLDGPAGREPGYHPGSRPAPWPRRESGMPPR